MQNETQYEKYYNLLKLFAYGTYTDYTCDFFIITYYKYILFFFIKF